jgi:D-alanine-D-alanine ligase
MKTISVLHQGVEGSQDPRIVNARQVRDNIVSSISDLGYRPVSIYVDDGFEWIQKIIAHRPSMVFNAADLGFFLNMIYEPNIAAALDGTGIPYTGSDYLSLSSTNDKYASKRIMLEQGIPAPGCWTLRRQADDIIYPAIIKPRRLHNSEGLSSASVVKDRSELELLVGGDQKFINDYIAEEYIDGPEICAGFLGNGSHRRLLPIVSFDFGCAFDGRPKIRDYSAKWDQESAEYSQSHVEFAELSDKTVERVNRYTSEIAELFDIRDYARLDFRLKPDGNGGHIPLVIDVNANPDVNDNATLYKMARHAGMDYTQFIGSIVMAAHTRAYA